MLLLLLFHVAPSFNKCPSARCATAANLVCSDSGYHIHMWYWFSALYALALKCVWRHIYCPSVVSAHCAVSVNNNNNNNNNNNRARVECKRKSDTSKSRGQWNHLKIIQTRAKYRQSAKWTTENSHIWHCVHTSESTDVEVQNVFNMGSNITCININCNYRTATTLYTLETWFVSGIVYSCQYPE